MSKLLASSRAHAGCARHWLATASLAGLACAALQPDLAHSATCTTPNLGAVAGVERSHWTERDASSRVLVRERGTLRMAGLQTSGTCADMDWLAQWTLARGQRDYDGWTNTHTPFQSHSSLQAQRLSLQAWLPLHAGWSTGPLLTYTAIARDIAGQGNVLGYPERFRYFQAAIGARFQTALTPDARLTASIWLGGGPRGRVKIDLPRFDPATLSLGRSHMLALAVALEGGAATDQPGWSWRGDLTYRYEQINAGNARTLTRNGTPSGTALQPRSEQRHWGANVGVTYRF
ncbi:hypothetical protein [Oryzisolibacter sp. LB2S]|uniref:hypothetical protein n=1 Tax=Alicycliphilus soli TaxID=3228789 RepID=UPI003457B267